MTLHLQTLREKHKTHAGYADNQSFRRRMGAATRIMKVGQGHPCLPQHRLPHRPRPPWPGQLGSASSGKVLLASASRWKGPSRAPDCGHPVHLRLTGSVPVPACNPAGPSGGGKPSSLASEAPHSVGRHHVRPHGKAEGAHTVPKRPSHETERLPVGRRVLLVAAHHRAPPTLPPQHACVRPAGARPRTKGDRKDRDLKPLNKAQ